MSENGSRDPSVRQKRVQRLKRLIIFTLFTLILLPYLFCAVLLTKMRDLGGKVDELSGQVAELQGAIRQQQEKSAAAERPEDLTKTESGSSEERDIAAPGDSVTLQFATETDAGDADAGRADEDPPMRKVYLTFDDGPSAKTGQILDILAEYDVKATFFVLGKEDEVSQEAIRRIVEEGHTLGMHSYTHKYAELYGSLEDFQADFEREQAYLYELTGVESRFYRFPGGSSNKVSRQDMHIFADWLDSQGIVYYDWNISSGDASSRLLTKEEVYKNCTKQIESFDTAVILLHDSAAKPTTVEALPEIIEKIQGMENTVLLPITEDTEPIQHIQINEF